VRYRGFSFLSVEAVSGTAPRLKVSALASSGERIDHFEVRLPDLGCYGSVTGGCAQ
jgi:hypothetical protein